MIIKRHFPQVKRHFLQICNRVTALHLRQNLIFTQYFENEMTELSNLIYILSLTRSTLGL